MKDPAAGEVESWTEVEEMMEVADSRETEEASGRALHPDAVFEREEERRITRAKLADGYGIRSAESVVNLKGIVLQDSWQVRVTMFVVLLQVQLPEQAKVTTSTSCGRVKADR